MTRSSRSGARTAERDRRRGRLAAGANRSSRFGPRPVGALSQSTGRGQRSAFVPKTELDFGATAKAYAGDRIADLIWHETGSSVLVTLGSSAAAAIMDSTIGLSRSVEELLGACAGSSATRPASDSRDLPSAVTGIYGRITDRQRFKVASMPRREVPTPVLEAGVMLLMLALLVPAVAVGWLIGRHPRHNAKEAVTAAATTPRSVGPVNSSVASGGHLFVQFACAQCHGMQGRGGVSPDVPALTTVAKTLQPSQLRSIIDHGLGASANPTKPFMPVWGQVISTTQVNDLVAYIRAGLPTVPTATPPAVPNNQGAAVEGSVLYVKYGCINCHGPNGLGGVPNPLSPDKRIPPLSGQAFRQQFNTDQKIIAVIQSGSVIGRAPIVSMPHWGGILSQAQLHALAAYLKTLKTAPSANG
jgi:cbb3-type cytochrome c oxidase subunit III